MLGCRKKSLIGLDIGTSEVRMIQLQRRDGVAGGTGREEEPRVRYVVTGACIHEIAPWGDSPELRRMHTIRAIRAGLASGAVETGPAVCGLRGHEVVVRGFEFPTLPSEEIEGAVTLEASQICPFGTDESTLDFQVTSSDAKKTRGFWVAANDSLIQSTRQLVHDAGLHCARIDVDGLALLNCLRHTHDGSGQTEDDLIVPRPSCAARGEAAVLDVGGACTTVAARDQTGRPFVRDIGSGSDDIVRRLAAETGVPLEIARTTLLSRDRKSNVPAAVPAAAIDHGHPPARSGWETRRHPEDKDLLWGSLEGACAELVEAITTTLRYHAAQQSCARVERLLVCGALATVAEFIDLLRGKLSVDVASWNPLTAMSCGAGEECRALVREAGASLAVAAGLAMRPL